MAKGSKVPRCTGTEVTKVPRCTRTEVTEHTYSATLISCFASNGGHKHYAYVTYLSVELWWIKY